MADVEFVRDEPSEIPERAAKKSIPSDYIPIKLSTLGKLDTPAIIHVRDYTGSNILTLAAARDVNFLNRLIDVLDDVVYEGFDCKYLHEYELEEIMLNILANFWTSTIQNYPYPYEQDEYDTMDDERKENITKGLENLQVDIPISSLKTNPISKEFKEPISINIKGKTVQFILPRIIHFFNSQSYIEEKYSREYQEFSYIEQIYDIEDKDKRKAELDKIPHKELIRYRDFSDKRGVDYIIAKQSQLIYGVGGKEIKSLQDKIKAYNSNISIKFWKTYGVIAEKQSEFGVNKEVNMISPITNEPVTRRCQFRPVDYIPSNEAPDSGEYTVLFG